MLVTAKTNKFPVRTGLSEKCVVLRVNDGSMEPEFDEGETFVLDPTVTSPQDRSFVVARLSDGTHVLRRFVAKRGKAFDLQAESEDWKTISSTPEQQIEIVGVVVEHHRRHFG